MYEYLFSQGDFPFKEPYFRFMLINAEDQNKKAIVFNFLKDLIYDSLILEKENDYFLIYFSEPDISFKDLLVSISDDFSIKIKVYVSGRIEAQYPENFLTLYEAIKEFLDSRPYIYASNAELIKQIIRTDFKRLKTVKSAILNRIYEDSQIEKLILAMFDNNLNVTRTAKAVYMHRNTIINKLEYIKLETGLNLQNFTDALCMYWLIKSK
ncbi:MAG: helix-turn-helix domain-containing protein [Bacilli bacterium]|nr:helix-turn-helix domain-containing protein [Bacilli bacterium]